MFYAKWFGRIFLSFVLALFFCSANAQLLKFYGKPVVGSVTRNSAKVWVAYKSKGLNRVVLLDTITKIPVFPIDASTLKSQKKGIYSSIVSFNDLSPDRFYVATADLDNGTKQELAYFRTLPDSVPQQITFTLGSCALMDPGFLRGAFPGGASRIFKSMRKSSPDFHVWLGDNVYYFPKHYSSPDNMFMRWIKIRDAFSSLNTFMNAVPQYAIWDDHDYGPNDAGKDYHLKDSSLLVFKHFWPNNYPRQQELNGNYFTFRNHDVEFFMTDDRYFRDEPCDTCAFLGETQLVWLKNKLMLSDASFKFICIGTQLLNTNGFGESYDQYKREQQDLINFITGNNIKGVVFLTGDKHYSEVCKREINGYPVYDFTCSPLTTMALPRRMLGAYNNGDRIPGSDYAKKNFGRITISGSRDNRACHIEIFSVGGKLKRKLSIAAAELQKK